MLYWKLYGRKLAVKNALAFLKGNQYPQREYAHDNFGNYLARIQDDPQYPPTLRQSAVDIERVLDLIEEAGITVGARAHSAYNMALDIYAPRSLARRQDL
jgi:hypothetical protein